MRSARVLQNRAHRNIVQYVQALEEQDHLFIQTELCACGSLSHLLDCQQEDYHFPEDKVWTWIVDIAIYLQQKLCDVDVPDAAA